jgi:hypothetical protein
MSRLLSLAVLVVALWAIDSYAFNGRYFASVTEELNYFGRTLNDGVQGMMRRLRPWARRARELSQMSKLYAALLVVVALMGMAAIGTLALVVVTDAGNLAYPTLRPGMNPWARRGLFAERAN